jgi:hypothetical protein
MLWYKSWLDTRWAFLIALGLLVMLAGGSLFSFETVQDLIQVVSPADLGDGKLADALREEIELQSTFRGYVWSQWFAQNFTTLLMIFAAVLGSGSPFSGSGHGVLFSLALPVSRERWIATRAGMALAELLVLAIVPSIAIAAFAPAAGQQFALGEALVYGLCAFVGASVFASIAVLLSTMFEDVWRPLLLTCCAAFAIAVIGYALPDGRGLFAAMSGGDYFYDGSLLWPELLVAAIAAAGFVYAAGASVARRDF